MSNKGVAKMYSTLASMRDETYAAFQRKLLPTVPPDAVIGVRTPQLRALAKQMLKNGAAEGFLSELPHAYFDENQLHAFILSEMKDFDVCITAVEAFLPYIDNWATCDQLSPKAFKKSPERLLPFIDVWLASDKTYTVRFGVGILMQHFLDERFSPEYPEKVAAVSSDEYYINMMIAWYFATALAKQYKSVLPFIEKRVLPAWTHNKAIQKARESLRITPEQKEYLNSLKVKQ
ncbi:MAG: DNA alkylation repair protein [Clostridia bacterium]|nr:DNA alkylation repair protein [Clostridia bacterium]